MALPRRSVRTYGQSVGSGSSRYDWTSIVGLHAHVMDSSCELHVSCYSTELPPTAGAIVLRCARSVSA